ncbi:MAG: MotA/TolQ/ExbB proton channel family protein [Methanobacteriaceae archaeon]
MVNETMNPIFDFTNGIYTFSGDTLHILTQCFLIPVILILIVFFVYVLINIGMGIAEYRLRKRNSSSGSSCSGSSSSSSSSSSIGSSSNMGAKGTIIRISNIFKNSSIHTGDDFHEADLNSIKSEIENSNITSSEKEVINVILDNADLDYETQKSLAREFVEEKELNLFKRLEKIDIVAKISPALGLMGTLIPLGPGLLALGSGDTQTLADSLIIAFDTTVLGMATASLAFVISKIRKRWYLKDIDKIDNLAEFTLEALNAKKKK